jgi:hypothetical protein
VFEIGSSRAKIRKMVGDIGLVDESVLVEVWWAQGGLRCRADVLVLWAWVEAIREPRKRSRL